jgi:hypothetical protein
MGASMSRFFLLVNGVPTDASGKTHRRDPQAAKRATFPGKAAYFVVRDRSGHAFA